MIVTTAIKNGRELVLPDTGSDPCDGSLVPNCPLVKEKVYAFNRYFEAPKDFPAVSNHLISKFLSYPVEHSKI